MGRRTVDVDGKNLGDLIKYSRTFVGQYNETGSIYSLFKATILYHRYRQLGGRKFIDINMPHSIVKSMDLIDIYDRENFNDRVRYPNFRRTLSNVLYMFLENIRKTGIAMSVLDTVSKPTRRGYSVSIKYGTPAGEHWEIAVQVERFKGYYNIEGLLAKLILETFLVMGGNMEEFRLWLSIMDELGLRLSNNYLVR